jgi:sec-independent protein translocase protein TatB
MFDIAWQEILVIGIVALIVVGPKELPTLLRTVGKYLGVVKRQAAEFRAQFDEAMRESELDQLRKDVENIKTDAENSFRDVERSVDSQLGSLKRELDDTAHGIGTNHVDMHDANGLPMMPTDSHTPPPAPLPGAGAAAIAAAAAAAPPDASAPPKATESPKVNA